MRLISATLLTFLAFTACVSQKSKKVEAQTGTGGQAETAAQPTAAATDQSPGTTVSSTSFSKLFRGNISGHAIEMKLRREGESLSGTYAYDGKDQSLTLKGRIDSQGKLTLQEFDAKGKQTGRFDGQYSEQSLEGPNAAIDGKWLPSDGKDESPVYLTEQPVEFTNSLQIVPKTIKEKRLGIRAVYPQLTGSNEQPIADFNKRVSSMIEKAVSDYRSDAAGAENHYYEADYNVLLATGDLISVEINEDVFADGAHPNAYHYALTYDLRAGREVSMESLFKQGSDYKKVIRQYSADNMNERIRKEYETDGKQTDEGPRFSAEDSELESWNSWAMSRRGVFVYYHLPHVVAALDRVFIPYSALKDFIDPNGPAAAFANEKG
ncbi:MAG TPA: hypothetical protein VF708_14290 [Pyrinomonadaceae bacterium]|jgi:hypothetical protein